MLARNEPGAADIKPVQKGTRTEIAVLDPEVIGLHSFQHRPEQRALLRMAIFTGKDRTHKPERGFIDH